MAPMTCDPAGSRGAALTWTRLGALLAGWAAAAVLALAATGADAAKAAVSAAAAT
jgi:hypothetical protein